MDQIASRQLGCKAEVLVCGKTVGVTSISQRYRLLLWSVNNIELSSPLLSLSKTLGGKSREATAPAYWPTCAAGGLRCSE